MAFTAKGPTGRVNSEADNLREEVFGCERCADVAAFSRPSNQGPFFKFPPIIGSQGEVDILFIGINPRRSKSNLDLHEWLMESPGAFAQLAKNVQKDGQRYVAVDGEEEHYHCHMIVVEGVFGVTTAFESKAAVTELLYCASSSEPTILSQMKSPCAGIYLKRVIQIVKPKVVIAVGAGVRRHLQKYFKDKIPVPIVQMEHPGPLFGKSRLEKMRKMQMTIDGVREVLGQNTVTL